MIYVIGSLKNPNVPKVAAAIREATGQEVFDDWFAAGPEADDYWRDYERSKGHNFVQALCGKAAQNVYAFDRRNLEASEVVVLVLPAGKSGHLELGWALGRGKKGYILLADDPERFDVMYQFADGTFNTLEALIAELKSLPSTNLVSEISTAHSGVHVSIPRLGISCACSDCERDRRNLRGSGTLAPEVVREFV